MTQLVQSKLEHGQDIVGSKVEHAETPVDHASNL